MWLEEGTSALLAVTVLPVRLVCLGWSICRERRY